MFTALLDTCVLWPSLQRDFLLSLAAEGMYRPAWSAAILRELEYHEAAKLVRRGEDQAAAAARARYLIGQMRTAFNDAETQGWEGLEGTYGLPDPDDEHVVAAAVVADAGAIVTHNVKDFPQGKIPKGIDVIPPAKFAANTVALDPFRSLAAVSAIAGRSGNKGPVRTADEVLDTLQARYEMSAAAELIRQVNDRLASITPVISPTSLASSSTRRPVPCSSTSVRVTLSMPGAIVAAHHYPRGPQDVLRQTLSNSERNLRPGSALAAP